jgi:hypothetical protein
MPSLQRGTVQKRSSGNWAARWCDENGKAKLRGGFDTRSEALEHLATVLPAVQALRRGDVGALRRRQMPTLGELAAEFTGQHVAEASTIASLEKRLRYALDGPKLDGKAGWRDVRIDRLHAAEIGAWRKALPGRSAYGIHKSLRQVLHDAVRAKLLDETRPWRCRTRSRSARRCRRSRWPSWRSSRTSSLPRSGRCRCSPP